MGRPISPTRASPFRRRIADPSPAGDIQVLPSRLDSFSSRCHQTWARWTKVAHSVMDFVGTSSSSQCNHVQRDREVSLQRCSLIWETDPVHFVVSVVTMLRQSIAHVEKKKSKLSHKKKKPPTVLHHYSSIKSAVIWSSASLHFF